jgi:hypothetical protein
MGMKSQNSGNGKNPTCPENNQKRYSQFQEISRAAFTQSARSNKDTTI